MATKNPALTQELRIGDGGAIKTAAGTDIISVSAAGVASVNANIQDSLAEGSIYIGNSSGVTSELDVSTDTQILVGNGTTLASVAVSGDVTLANTGAATVAAVDLETATVTNIADTEMLIGTGAGTANFAAMSGDATMANTGAVTIGAEKVTNAMQKVPKIVVYQEVCPVASFTDGGGAVGTLDLSTTIPAGAVFLNAAVHNIVGFAGDTSAALTIGDGTDVDRYNTATLDVFTTAPEGVAAGAPSGTAWHSAVKTPKLTITSATDFGLVVTDGNGSVTVTLVYIRPV